MYREFDFVYTINLYIECIVNLYWNPYDTGTTQHYTCFNYYTIYIIICIQNKYNKFIMPGMP